MRLFSRFLSDQRGGMVADMGKAAVAIAFLSVVAANWLSHGISEVDRSQMNQIAADASRNIKGRMGFTDPTTTGSISKRAADTKLDPCVAPAKR